MHEFKTKEALRKRIKGILYVLLLFGLFWGQSNAKAQVVSLSKAPSEFLSQGYYYDLKGFYLDPLWLPPFSNDYILAHSLGLRPFLKRPDKNEIPFLTCKNFRDLPFNTSLAIYRYGCVVDPEEHDQYEVKVLSKMYPDPYVYDERYQRVNWLRTLPGVCQKTFIEQVAESYLWYTQLSVPGIGDHPLRLRQYEHFFDEVLFAEQQKCLYFPGWRPLYLESCLPIWKKKNISHRPTKPHVITRNELPSYELMLPANAPAYPSELTGPSEVTIGATNVYTMVLDTSFGKPWQAESLSNDDVHYHFTIYNITEPVEKGLQGKVASAVLSGQALTGGVDVEKWAASRRDLARRLENFNEDNLHAVEDTIEAAQNLGGKGSFSTKEAAKEILMNIVSLNLASSAALVSLGGSLVRSLVEWAGGDEQERSIPSPTKEGFYLIRCIATPKRRGNILRASSVAVKIVEVRSSMYWVKNALQAGAANMSELQIKEAIAESDEQSKNIAEEQQALTLQLTGAADAVLKAGVNQAQARLTGASLWEQDQRKEELSRITSLYNLAVRRKDELIKEGHVLRPQAFLASDETSVTYSLLLQLISIHESDGQFLIKLSDVTTQQGEIYTARAKTEEEALWKVFRIFAGHCGYGRGMLAVELPPGLLPSIQKRSDIFRLAPRGSHLLLDRLNDLTIVLTVVSMAVPGIGQVAMLMGGSLAADRLYERFKNQNLTTNPKTWDGEAAMDILMLLGAAGSGLGALGKFTQVKVGNSFVLASLGNAAKIEQTLLTLQHTAYSVAKIAGVGGLVVGNVKLLVDLKKVNEQELRGIITHSEAKQLSTGLFLNALLTNALFIQGMRVSNSANSKRGPKNTASVKYGTPPPETEGTLDKAERKTNALKAESPLWERFKYYQGNIRRGIIKGKTHYFQWDYTHNDIEIFDERYIHRGSMDPKTGVIYKPPVKGRKLKF